MALAVAANLGDLGTVEVGERGSPISKGKQGAQEDGVDSALFAALMACLAGGAVQGQPGAVAVEGKAGGQGGGGAAEVAGVESVGAVGAVVAPQAKEIGKPAPALGQQMGPERLPSIVLSGLQTANATDTPKIRTENPQRAQPATTPDGDAASVSVGRQTPSSARTEAAALPDAAGGEAPAEVPVGPAAPVAQFDAPGVTLRTVPGAQAVVAAASGLAVEAQTQPTQGLLMPGNVPNPANSAQAGDETERAESGPAADNETIQPAASPASAGAETSGVTADAVVSSKPVDSPRAAPRSGPAPAIQTDPTAAPERDGGGRSVATVDGAAPVAARRDRKPADDTASVRPQFSGQEAAPTDIDAAAFGGRISRAVAQAAQARPTAAGQGATGKTVSTLHVALDPPGLGTVHVRVETAGDVVRATVTVPDTGISRALQHLEPQVRAALAEHGLALEQFQLSHQSDQGSRNPQADRPEFVATRPRAPAAIERTEQVAPRAQMSGGLDVVV